MRVLALFAVLAAVPQDEYFPIKAGTRWVYSVKESSGAAESTKEVASETKSATAIGGHDWAEVTNFLDYDKVYLRSDATGIQLRLEAPTATDDAALTILKLPAKASDTWTGKLTDKSDVAFTVEGDEELKVDAGSFKCVRVGFEVTERDRSNTKHVSKGTLWFSAGTGLVQGSIQRDLDCHTTTTRAYTLKRIEQK